MSAVVGQWVKYALTQSNVETANFRRTVRGRDMTSDTPEPIAHGGPLTIGQICPMIVTVVSSNGTVSGQVLLDGDDSLWVTNILQGTVPGTWQ